MNEINSIHTYMLARIRNKNERKGNISKWLNIAINDNDFVAFWCFVSIFTSINMQIGANVSFSYFQPMKYSMHAPNQPSLTIALCVIDVYIQKKTLV